MNITRIKIKDWKINTKQDYIEYADEGQPNTQYWSEWNYLNLTLNVDGVEVGTHNIELPFFLLDRNTQPYYIAFYKDTQVERHHYNKIKQGLISFDYLDSCSCGHAGCNGYWVGVLIKRKRHHFIYTAPKNRGYERSGILGTGKLKIKVPVEDVLGIRRQLTEIAKSINPKDSVASVIYSITGDSPAPNKEWTVEVDS